jgi:hypothetical protein
LIFEWLLRFFVARRTTMLPLFTLPFFFQIILVNLWFISSYHPLKEIWTLFILHPVLAISNTSLFLLQSQKFRNDFLHTDSACLNLLSNLFAHYLY